MISLAQRTELETLIRLAADGVGGIDSQRLAEEVARDAVLVARDRQTDSVLGFAVMRREPHCEGHLLALAVDKFHRGEGIGGALLHGVEDQLLRTGARRLSLEVRSDNPRAQDFYSRHGFQPEGLHSHVYPDGEDAVRMARPL